MTNAINTAKSYQAMSDSSVASLAHVVSSAVSAASLNTGTGLCSHLRLLRLPRLCGLLGSGLGLGGRG